MKSAARSSSTSADLTDTNPPRNLSNWNKSNLLDDFLAGIADRKIYKLFRSAGRLAVRVVKCRPRVRIFFPEHALLRGHRTVDRTNLDPAGFGVSESDVAHAIRILRHFRCDLLVAGHLLRVRRIIAFLHRQLL